MCNSGAKQWQAKFIRKKLSRTLRSIMMFLFWDRHSKIENGSQGEDKKLRTGDPKSTKYKSRSIWPAGFSFRNLLLFNVLVLGFSRGVRCKPNSMMRNSQQRIRDWMIQVWDLRFEVWALCFELWGLSFELWALRFEVWGWRFEVWGLRFKVSALRIEVWGLRSEVWGVLSKLRL